MKFYCDKCRTKYSIADEKVRGKVLKVRCKKCSHIITVREAASPAAGPKAAAPPRLPQRGEVQWYYSINGQSFGPLRQGQLANKFARGELGDAVYVWNETFTEWKLVGEVAVFAPALARAAKKSPPQRTLGISQPFEAINQETVEQEGAAAGAKAPEAVVPDEDEQETRQQARQDRLEALRARLQLGSEPEPEREPARAEEAGGEPLGASPSQAEAFEDSTELLESPFADGQLAEESEADEASVQAEIGDWKEEEPLSKEFDLGMAETLPSDKLRAQAPEEVEEPFAEPEGAAVYDGLFSGHGDEEDFLDEYSEPQDSESAGDAVPFFPDAPKLAGEATKMGRADEVTGSLLIQLNAIKSDGRKRAIATVIAAVLVLGVIGALVYVGLTSEKEEIVDERGPRLRMDNVGKAPQFREYTEEERRRGLAEIFLDQELVISREDSKAAFEEEERRNKGGSEERAEAEGAKLPSVPRIDPSAYRIPEGELDGMQASAGQEAGVESRFQRGGIPGLAGSGSEGELSGLGALAGGGDDSFEDERFRAMAAVQTDTQRGIYNPRDEFDELSAPREALTGQDIARGMQNVMNSVGSCRERHIMRGGTLSQESVEVTLDIMPNGRVETLKLAPASLDGTDFGRCMHSHIRRWRFPPFKGETTRVRTPFLLQD